jgi:hypothetical protein
MKTKLLLVLAALAFATPAFSQSKDDDPTEKENKKKSDIEHIEMK